MKVVTLGPIDTYSHEVAKFFFQDTEIELKNTIAEVIDYACKNNLIALVPYENSIIGPIKETNELIKTNNLIITKEIDFPINHNLLANSEIKSLEDIKRVYSQSNAINQCMDFVSKNLNKAEAIYTNSTALAAKTVKENCRNDEVAIASLFASQEYGLYVVNQNIQDKANNFTKFVLVSK